MLRNRVKKTGSHSCANPLCGYEKKQHAGRERREREDDEKDGEERMLRTPHIFLWL
jgi:hypothetical protein